MVGDNRNLFLSHANEPVKQHNVFDGNTRIIAVYTARADAKNGDKCIVTEYKYVSPASTVISDRKEGFGEWNSAWDW